MQSRRDRLIWAAKMGGLLLVLALALAPLIFWALRGGAEHRGNVAQPVPSQTPTLSLSSPTPTPQNANAPVKGLTDEPSYRWWRWPNAPQPDSWWANAQKPQALQQQLDLMHELGVKLFRLELPWSFVAPTMPGGGVYNSALARDPNWGGYHWQTWDAIVRLATDAGIQLVPQVVYSPAWASGSAPNANGGGPNWPPHSAQYYGDFVYAAATRYAGRIHYWEMWNEPDLAAHTWSASISRYVDLILKPGYLAVKQADPTAKVLLGGLGYSASIAAIYAAGAQAYFDIVNFHVYGATAAEDGAALSYVRQVARAHGDAQKPIWLTEFGLKTQPDGAPGNPGTISASNIEAAQAQLVHDVYSQLQAQAIFFYQLHDTAVTDPGGAILKVEYYGLVSRDYTHRKLGFAAYQEAVGGVLPTFTDSMPVAG